jgi:hypothetical protein
MHINDIPAFNCREDLTGICVGFELLSCYSFHLKQPRIKIVKWHLQVLTKNNSAAVTSTASVCLTTKLQPAIFQDIMFGIKFIFSCTRDVIDGLERFYSNHDCSAYKSFTCFAFFAYIYE